jgi:hypothetical protein
MSPIQTVTWIAIFFFLSLMAQFAFADEPMVKVTTELPASKAQVCATEGCIIITEDEMAQLIQAAIAEHRAATCKNHEV